MKWHILPLLLTSAVTPLTPPLRNTMTSSTVQQFESQLEQFEYACNQSATLTELLGRLRDSVSVIAPLRQVNAAVVEETRLICVGNELTESDSRELAAAFASAQAQQQTDGAYFSGRSLLFIRALSREHRLVIQFCMDEDPGENVLLVNATRTLSDCFAVAVNRDLASNLYERLQDRELAGPFLREIYGSGTFEQCAHTVADQGSGLLSDGRVTVMASDSNQLQVVATTGVRIVDRTSDAVLQIESLADAVIRKHCSNRWIETRGLQPGGDFSKQLAVFAMNGIRAIRVEPLQSNANSDHGVRRVCVMIEIFESQPYPTDNRVEFLMAQVGAAIQTKPTLTSTGSPTGWLRTTRRKTWLAACLTFILLTVVQADFEVEVNGQIFPVERYRVFAPDDGIIDMLSVNADDTVAAGQFLMRLENAEKILERSRLLGDVESTSSRLLAIRAARSSNNSMPGNQNNRSIDLSSEEQQLEQKLASLREEQLLVDHQIESLSLHSPIAGVVYQRRLKEQLEARPVQRGQLLLEIVNTHENWQLELQVPENVVGYVRNGTNVNQAAQNHAEGLAQEHTQVGPAIRYWLNSQRSQSFETNIDTLEPSIHINEQRLTCLATAPCYGLETAQLRPGQSVTARIHCGRCSLGFVLFREVIEYLQKKRFAWL